MADTDGDGLSDGDEILKHKTSPAKADTDEDGLTDPDEINNFMTNPLLADTDSDGLNDAEELQKHETDPLKADTDDDGLTDSVEINKTMTNPLLADTDGDKIVDGKDKCPRKPETVNGYEDEDGCPDKKPAVVFEKKAPIVLTGVTFKTGKAELTDSAKETLGKVVTTLTEHTEIALEIQGHTDSVGRRSSNMKLSQKRANSVKDYLVAQGIAAERLTAKGYGPDVPVATNDTKAGRQQNRRISFIRVD
jgi:outer membrane protein OmpA-like peptidoglycan-associated protein